MDNYERLIIRYLDKQLTEDERIEFERSLLADSDLRTEFEKYQKVQELIPDDNNPELSNDYFNGVIPAFRGRLEKKSKPVLYRNYGIAFTTFFLMMILVFITDKLFMNQDLGNDSIKSVVENFSEDELNELAEYYSDEYYDLLSNNEQIMQLSDKEINLESIFSNISSEERISIISGYDLTEIYSMVDSEILEAAYNEILSKRIL